ncbi:MAG: enoyl-CoA hydratase/isomerase [Bradyrhizobium sp.]|nr:enoyl-CoA hydratase/isomerase [Bradyrhizobium sp.]
MSDQPPLLAERHGPTLLLTLNRPDRLNALNRPMQKALEAQFLAADADPTIRVIVLTGAGRAFCSGADVGGLKQSAAGSSNPAAVKATVPKFTNRQAGIFKPVIVAVNGVCAGAGLHYVADGDIVIASEAASFTDTHVNVGQVTALEPIGLIQKIGAAAVLRMVILGKAERLSAAKALEIGLVSEVVAPERLLERALELAEIAAAGSPTAMRRSLQAVWDSFEMPLAQAYDNGWELLIRHRAHPDAAEGPAAFIEKRAPNWQD